MEIIKVDPFQNVAANQLATAQYQPDRPSAVYGFVLTLGGTVFTIAQISEIKIKAGGKELMRLTGSRLDSLNQYDGVVTDAAQVFIGFADPTARTVRGELLGMFDTTIYRDIITLEVTIAGATAPTLEAHALITAPKLVLPYGFTADEAQTHRALIETILQPSAAVSRQAFAIGLGSAAGALIRKVGFFNANLTSVAIKKNGLDIFEDIATALNSYVQDDLFARVPQSGLYVWDPTVSGNQSDSQRTVKGDGAPFNYQVLVTTSASDTITVYSDVYTKLPLI